MFKYFNLANIILLFILLLLIYLGKIEWYYCAIPIILYLIYGAIGSIFFKLNFFVKAVHKLENDKICLTFDDGPHENTEAILDILNKHEIKAIFFCIGTQIEKFPQITERIVREGHILANHTYSHSNTISLQSALRFKEEISKTNEILSKYTGKEIHYFRPPYGVTNPSIAKALKGYPEKIIGWNVRSFDTVAVNKSKFLEKILQETQAGSIVLFHDTQPITAKILDEFITELKNRNFEFSNQI